MIRRLQREKALQVLYAIDVGNNDIDQILSVIDELLIEEYNLNEIHIFNITDIIFCLKFHLALSKVRSNSEINDNFTTILVKGVHNKLEYIDNVIKKYSINWPINRLSRVDHNILRIAIYELLFIDDIPYSVTANESVELAKKFGSEKSFRFINGILGKIIEDFSSGKYDGLNCDIGGT
jgi:N utilization substance protein B